MAHTLTLLTRVRGYGGYLWTKVNIEYFIEGVIKVCDVFYLDIGAPLASMQGGGATDSKGIRHARVP